MEFDKTDKIPSFKEPVDRVPVDERELTGRHKGVLKGTKDGIKKDEEAAKFLAETLKKGSEFLQEEHDRWAFDSRGPGQPDLEGYCTDLIGRMKEDAAFFDDKKNCEFPGVIRERGEAISDEAYKFFKRAKEQARLQPLEDGADKEILGKLYDISCDLSRGAKKASEPVEISFEKENKGKGIK